MKLLFVGDIVGTAGMEALTSYLPYLKQTHRPQVTIVNAENAADGRGLTEKLYKQILSLGVEAITLGNHSFDNRDLYNFIEGAKPLVRPANLPATTPGKGIHYVRYNQYQVAVINVLGTVFMNPVTSPFLMIDELVDQARKQTPFIFVDCHAEATSEKLALAHYLDGRVSAVVGTHTHVQTNDAKVLAGGTASLTDVVMTGAQDSILGFAAKEVIQRFTSQLPTRLVQESKGPLVLSACLIDLDDKTGLAKSIVPIQVTQESLSKYY